MDLTEAQKLELARLHSLGYGRNAIATEMKINQRWVSENAAAMGLSFSKRYMTDAARRAAQEDAASKRAHLALLQIEDALNLREMMYEECIIGDFGGRDNVWSEVKLDRPTFSDIGKIQQAVYSASANAMRLLDSEAGTNRATINLVVATAEKLGLVDSDGE